ncbi:MAG: glycosyltransferase [Cyanobacteria bacterium J06623_1]
MSENKSCSPLISVVLAVKNGEKYLKWAIKSVLQQDYQNYELILVDGNSTDNTEAIARSYPLRLIKQQGQGIADAYNLGIAEAKGEYLTFISHDDRWTNDKLSSQLSYLQQHPEAKFCVALVQFFLEPGAKIPAGFRPELLTGEHTALIMETLMARREVFQTVGKFNTDYHVAEDVDWYSRAKDARIPYGVVQHTLLHKRVHNRNTSLTSAANNQNLLKILRQSIKRKRDLK